MGSNGEPLPGHRRCVNCYGEPPESDEDICAACGGSGDLDETDMPPPVDCEVAWPNPPEEPSPRLTMWLDQIADEDAPDFAGYGYYIAAELYGVTIWEYINVLSPAIHGHGHARPSAVKTWLASHGLRIDLVPALVSRMERVGWSEMTEADYQANPPTGFRGWGW